MRTLHLFPQNCLNDLGAAFRVFPWTSGFLCLFTLLINGWNTWETLNRADKTTLYTFLWLIAYATLAGLLADLLRLRHREAVTAHLPRACAGWSPVCWQMLVLLLSALGLAMSHWPPAQEETRLVARVAVLACLGIPALLALLGCSPAWALSRTLSALFGPVLLATLLNFLWLVFTITLTLLFDGSGRIWEAMLHLLSFLNCACVLLFLGALKRSLAEESAADREDRGATLLVRILYTSAFAYAALLVLYFLYAATQSLGRGSVQPYSVVHLVVWFSGLSLLFFWVKERLTTVDRVFVALQGILLVAAFVAIFLRIRQYGLTPNRYFVVAGLCWLVFAYLRIVLQHDCRRALWALLALLLVGIWTPLGAMPMSLASQKTRFVRLDKTPENRKKLEDIVQFLNQYETGERALANKVERETLLVRIPQDTRVYASFDQDRTIRGFAVSGYDCAFFAVSRRGKSQCGDLAVQVEDQPDETVRVLYQGQEEAVLHLYRLLLDDIPRNSGKKELRHFFPEELRWIKVQSDKLEIALYLESADIHKVFRTDGTESDRSSSLEYHVFVRKRPEAVPPEGAVPGI